ncbi:hypothetical protein PR202_gb01844 [Eleusine coracana subsp. coracana]|uniref:Uncharacterized protein n=1 Tax=Eleusine coracana subsp. coracana TaxID=191504 RepID=A0AAV5DXC7_ELECO|nr:hypothetical protein QOZ80_5AG0366180 [Eleusine coracana subsp. coracana]GJN14963.1 hypothetical protein PR202_gb01844 [Eleusine coracana subsp. coracana]
MESRRSGSCPHVRDGPAAASGEKVRRVMRAVYLVVVKKHQPKLAALGVHLHRMLSISNKRNRSAALSFSLSCRSMDAAAAVVHPLPRDHGRKSSSSSSRSTGAASLSSCRSMDPASAVQQQYQYRPREVQFSCKSTPPHKRRRARRRASQQHALEMERHGGGSAAAAVTRLFELMDVEEEMGKAADDVDFDYYDDGEMLDVEEAAAALPAPRQVRITDSPFAVREEEDDRMVDRRADEFITWFHEQLRTQQQRAAVTTERGASYYLVR